MSNLIIRPLAITGDLQCVFDRLQTLPHCVWLDSVSDHQFDRGRYSFLTADPVAFCNASLSSPDPWPVLGQWCRGLEDARESLSKVIPSDLPPFWGGIVGLLAYESAWWLEPTLRNDAWPRAEDSPGVAIGVYDWAIAVDHLRGKSWLISTGLNELFEIDKDRAKRRADRVIAVLEGVVPTSSNSAIVQRNHGCSNETVFSRESLPELVSNFTDESFSDGVAEIIRRICRGDSFQVNLAQTLTHPATCAASVLYRCLRNINPAPYAAYFDAGDYQVISSSPEGFLQVRRTNDGGSDGRPVSEVVTRPIKGTVRRTGVEAEDIRLGQELLASEKDRAENVMIVDLMRNDLSRVCTDASVEVTGLCELEKYQRVQHLVSTVKGTLRSECGVADLLAACFPGGSITGAPKVEAMRTIAELEQRPRGAYCGSLGYVSLSGAADFNILIRTITHRQNAGFTSASTAQSKAELKAATKAEVWEFPVGGGITARSVPDRETEETWVKAASLLEAIGSVG